MLVKYTFDDFKEGSTVACAQCARRQTVQFDNMAPKGWWTLFDSKRQASVFCSLTCIALFLSKVKAGPDVQILDNMSAFGVENE